jgi:hypothetical protein
MFKGRLRIWIATLISFCVIQCLITFAPTWFHLDDVTVKIDVDVDADLDEPLANKRINRYKLKLQNDNPDVIIMDKNLDAVGYTKYEHYVYSPLVLYARGLSNHKSGFIQVNTSNSYCYKVDLLSILQAMENGAEWESLGINSKVANGQVTLYIPNEQCAYYNDVVELFYLTLNNGKTPTAEEIGNLKGRVDSILSKCHLVADMKQAIYDEYQNPSDEHKVFIAPEYLWQRGGNSMQTGVTQAFMPAYFMDTVYLQANVYVKNVDNADEDLGEGFINAIKTKKAFMKMTGWRVKNSTFDLDNLSAVYLNTP